MSTKNIGNSRQDLNPFSPQGGYSGGMMPGSPNALARFGPHELARRKLQNLYAEYDRVWAEIAKIEKMYPDLARKQPAPKKAGASAKKQPAPRKATPRKTRAAKTTKTTKG